MRLMVLFGIVFAVCIYGADKRACGSKKRRAVCIEQLQKLKYDIIDYEAHQVLIASSKGEWDYVQELINKHPLLKKSNKEGYLIPLDVRDRDGFFPLWYAVRDGKEDMVRLLLAYGASVDKLFISNKVYRFNFGYQDETVLFEAVRRGLYVIAKLLLEGQANPNIESMIGNTPLCEAVKAKRADLAALLLKRGAVPHVQTMIFHEIDHRPHILVGGETPLMYAAQGSIDMVKLLLEYGACNINAKRADGNTAVTIAKKHNPQAVELLQNAACQTFPEPKRWIISFTWEHAWRVQEIRDERV